MYRTPTPGTTATGLPRTYLALPPRTGIACYGSMHCHDRTRLSCTPQNFSAPGNRVSTSTTTKQLQILPHPDYAALGIHVVDRDRSMRRTQSRSRVIRTRNRQQTGCGHGAAYLLLSSVSGETRAWMRMDNESVRSHKGRANSPQRVHGTL